jgi:hypothetical protein
MKNNRTIDHIRGGVPKGGYVLGHLQGQGTFAGGLVRLSRPGVQ